LRQATSVMRGTVRTICVQWGKLPQHVLDHFLKGEHVMHHLRRLWNGIWSDQFILNTLMRFGHSSGGIIGITLKPEALKVWALSRHICCQILMSLKEIEDGEDDQIGYVKRIIRRKGTVGSYRMPKTERDCDHHGIS